MSEQKKFDVEKILECRSEIIKDVKRILIPDLHTVFTGSAFVEWLVNNHNPNNLTREDLARSVHNELYSSSLAHQLIYPAEESGAFEDSPQKFYRFVDDQFKEYKKDKNVLNLYGIDTSELQFFFERKEDYSVLELLEELKKVMEEIYTDFLDESKTLVDYVRLEELNNVATNLVPIVTKLAFVDLTPLTESQNQLKTFFINIFNAMSIHAAITHYQREKKLKLSFVDRPGFYSGFKYNIGGHNYSLSDIEQGILRKNSPMAGGVTSTVIDFTIGGKTKGDRFEFFDPRRKYVLNYLDPRVHFALNSAAVSCPPYRYYSVEKIDDQLDRAAQAFCRNNASLQEEQETLTLWIDEMFKFYHQDFAKDDEGLANYVLSYLADEERDHFVMKMKQKPYKVMFMAFKWDLNARFSS